MKTQLKNQLSDSAIKKARAGLIPSAETDNAITVRAEFTAREWDTTLAALRMWQKAADQEDPGDITIELEQYDALREIAKEHANGLTVGEIDDLIARINLSQEPSPSAPELTPPLRKLIARVLALGEQDIYTDAPEYADRAEEMQEALLELSTYTKKPAPLPFAVVIGGVLQGVFYPVLDAKTEEESTFSLDYDLVDFDVLEGSSDEEIAEYWNNREETTRKYYQRFHPDAAKKFTDAVRRHKRAQRKAKK
jgi:hypothetical protein